MAHQPYLFTIQDKYTQNNLKDFFSFRSSIFPITWKYATLSWKENFQHKTQLAFRFELKRKL